MFMLQDAVNGAKIAYEVVGKMDKLKSTINELKELYKAGGVKNVRFSLTLSEPDNVRVERLVEKMQMSKQELVSKLFLSALTDLENEIMKADEEEDEVLTRELDTILFGGEKEEAKDDD